MNRLYLVSEVKNPIGGVIGYELLLNAEETEALMREIEKESTPSQIPRPDAAAPCDRSSPESPA